MTRTPGAGPDDKLTTDPPLPPGTRDVDALVGDPVSERGSADDGRARSRPDVEDVLDGEAPGDAGDADEDPVTVEPPD